MRQVSGLARLRGTGVLVFTFAALVLFAMPASAAAVSGTYTVTALVSNNGVPGTTVDARLVNAWGLVAGPGTPWWVSDNGADFSTLYNATGVKRSLNVSVDGAPTGIVFNGAATSFRVGPSNAGALFIFATEGGTIAGWNPSLGTASQVMADASGAGAVYKGLAIRRRPRAHSSMRRTSTTPGSTSSTPPGPLSRRRAGSSIRRFLQATLRSGSRRSVRESS